MSPPSPGPSGQVMGVVNVTDDSFSDGDCSSTVTAPSSTAWRWPQKAPRSSTSAVSRLAPAPPASTRGSRPRVLPVVKELAGQGITVSIDTMHAEVARPRWRTAPRSSTTSPVGAPTPTARLLADAKVPWVLMHWRSVGAARPHEVPPYADVVAEVRDEPGRRRRRGVGRRRPGQPDHRPRPGLRQDRPTQLGAVACAAQFVGTGIPVLVGASRKRFLGTLLAGADGQPRPPTAARPPPR